MVALVEEAMFTLFVPGSNKLLGIVSLETKTPQHNPLFYPIPIPSRQTMAQEIDIVPIL
jgi:hypothetical protein